MHGSKTLPGCEDIEIMRRHAICLALLWVGTGALRASAQQFDVTPFVGFETSGSYPLENPTTVGALRADAGKTFGAFFDYRIISNVHAEFQWVHNPTTYSGQSMLTGQYSQAFTTTIDQYQFGALYYFRDSGNTWRPYVAGSAGFTHDSNTGNNPSRMAAGFGLGGGVTYEFSNHFGLRTDARWMPTYGSNGTGSTCDEFGNCYPAMVRNYLQRFHVAIGLTIHP
jgi:hypothetical protein